MIRSASIPTNILSDRRIPVALALLGWVVASILCVSPQAPTQEIRLCEGTFSTGPDTTAPCEASDLTLQLASTSTDLRFGFSTAAGHLNEDVFSDLVVGDPGNATVYVYYGSLAPRIDPAL